MSRIAKKPIKIKEGVKVSWDGQRVVVLGPKGELSYTLPASLSVKIADHEVFVERKEETRSARGLHGLFYRLISAAIIGVSEGWTKTLELIGAGYRGRMEGENLILSIGFSHPVVITPPPGIIFSIEENRINTHGVDKYLVGQVAANIRKARPPEPYKGKGIRYLDEAVRRKPGKAAKVGAVA